MEYKIPMPYFQMLTFFFFAFSHIRRQFQHYMYSMCIALFLPQLFLTKCSCPERLHHHLLVLGLVLFLFVYFFFI